MTSTSTPGLARFSALGLWGSLILMWSKILVAWRWPGSPAVVLIGYGWDACFFAWFGSKIWIGYGRRRPQWTAESWRRYLRLTAMPLAALIGFLALVYLFDVRRGLFGSPGSALRALFIVIDLALMGFAIIGIIMAIGWMENGEPSEQFTRTRWFRRVRD